MLNAASVRVRMFPAHAGMTRGQGLLPSLGLYVPRPRGDDPMRAICYDFKEQCSPPTRG